MISLCVFVLLIPFSVQEMNSIHPATPEGGNNMSGVNFIYFFGPPATSEQIRSVREILKTDVMEINQMSNVNPVIKYLVSPIRGKAPLNGESDETNHRHDYIGAIRKARSPTYKKSGGGGGGGCCNTCGQCGGGCSGGGCGGGGTSGSYSQSTSYSSSSSGSYGSNGKRK